MRRLAGPFLAALLLGAGDPPERDAPPPDGGVVRAQKEGRDAAEEVVTPPVSVSGSSVDVSRTQPVPPAGPQPPLINRLFGIEDSRTKIYGWIENSYTGNPARPSDGMNFGVNPNNQANRWQGNQYYLIMERLVKPLDTLDYGYRFDSLFGSDWYFNHMQGLLDRAYTDHQFAGWDPAQFYADLHLPVLTPGGLDIRAGRWYSIVGFETVRAIARPLLSTPYMFNYGQPFTHTGVITNLHLTDKITIYNGTVNGWDRWIDRNYIWGYIGGINWGSQDEKTNLAFTFIEGPNQLPYFPDPNQPRPPTGVFTSPALAGKRNPLYSRSDRYLFTTVWTRHWTDRFTQVVEGDQAFETNVPGIGPKGRPGRAKWYGLANWFLYRISRDDSLTLVWRSEVWRDDDGIRTFNPSMPSSSGGGARVGYASTYSEITLGGIYKPEPNVWIRPEARFDWARGTHPYNGGQSSSQFTIALDVIFLF